MSLRDHGTILLCILFCFFFLKGILFIISLILTFQCFDDNVVARNGSSQAPGIWTPITDPNGAKVMEIGEFAVVEHNREAGKNISFKNVIEGESRVAGSGTEYKLRIMGKVDGFFLTFEGVVLDEPNLHSRKLVSFTSR